MPTLTARERLIKESELLPIALQQQVADFARYLRRTYVAADAAFLQQRWREAQHEEAEGKLMSAEEVFAKSGRRKQRGKK